MSIRECALRSQAFAALKDVYDHRETVAARWRTDGGKVVGELGCDVPDEFILAAGMLPVRVYAEVGKPLVETDKYLEYAFDPVVRAQFEKIVDGTYDRQIDALAISNSTDVIIRIYLYLRELCRVEPESRCRRWSLSIGCLPATVCTRSATSRPWSCSARRWSGGQAGPSPMKRSPPPEPSAMKTGKLCGKWPPCAGVRSPESPAARPWSSSAAPSSWSAPPIPLW